MTDNLEICDRCGSDACYITEVNHEVKNYHCFGCGFQTNTICKVDSDFLNEQMETMPNLYKELMGEDEEGKVWFPSFTATPKGIVFAKGASVEDWKWVGVFLKEEDGKKKMDMETVVEYDEKDYMNALEMIGIFEK
jgi:hypothetical protein